MNWVTSFAGDLSLDMPQHWFEEAFCESLSSLDDGQNGGGLGDQAALRKLEILRTQSDKIHQRRSQSDRVTGKPGRMVSTQHHPFDTTTVRPRKKIGVIAKQLAIEAHKNPAFFQAFHYMRLGGSEKRENSMEWLLGNWHSQCPEELKFAPSIVAKMLDLQPKN